MWYARLQLTELALKLISFKRGLWSSTIEENVTCSFIGLPTRGVSCAQLKTEHQIIFLASDFETYALLVHPAIGELPEQVTRE